MAQTSTSPSRYSHLETLFGPRTRDRIRNCSVLVIGAGGIGCELLKNLVCTGFGNITIVDLDTVDTSNLNRQFLFQKKHVKRPKAIVARETASAFNPDVTIHALHANVMDPQFDQAYFKSFDLVLNALDNLAARRHVNKMCVMTKVPLIESGTAGYNGQVQPIRSGKMECYDCQPKPLPKTFPVCTIRSTPSTAIHCIVWAKDYLFPQLFGPEDENEGADLDEAVKNGESVKEVETLKEEVKRMKEIRAQLDSPEMSKIVFEKLFQEDIKRLLMMEDMWEHRRAPTPLNYDQLASQELNQPENGHQNQQAVPSAGGLKDQQTLTLKNSFDLFCSSLLALGKRIQSDAAHEPLRWDKDDDDALDFVTAASNLRATIFDISQKTRFDVKEMAGNIIPAIATTNSAVSALIVFQAIKILSQSKEQDKTTQKDIEANEGGQPDHLPRIAACRPWYSKTAERMIVAGSIDPPNPHCEVCQVVYSTVHVHPDCTLKEFIKQVLKGKLYDDEDEESITIQEGDRLLYDPDYTDNSIKTFKELNLIDGQVERVLRITDEAEQYVPLMCTISKSSAPTTADKILVEDLPDILPHRPAPKPVSKPASDLGDNSDIEQVDAQNGSNGTKKRRTGPAVSGSNKDDDIIVVIDQLDDDHSNPRPTKKIKLDQHQSNHPVSNDLVEIVEIS
ncbi:hypothetical protein PSTG_13363 [Puccinia striiformis f. sp. tritici PST-78]|uniref:Ubiquitin-activating enzyme E1-like n=1 Tax=Puccinia striiformis f. sp. tritici PST-78 TaxID=1165861 RepID=A0A0L0V1U2_9BASI|nr:hypothetical protein PSTG_13363 [Puccinia striiformis f. sp. tritici PST-78]